ncbi:MAG TPA: hypothetical protein VE173_03000, partial [Longimicrobiales bacterium]|nr:hypothetical protein [Longimicrobiales bacterium]
MRGQPMSSESIDDSIRIQLAARCPFLYVVSWEEDRVLERVRGLGEPLFEHIYTWSITQGFANGTGERFDEKYRGPYAALD